MIKTRLAIGSMALVLALMLSGGLFGDDKKDAPVKGQLPANWKKLGLSDDQVKKIYSVQTDFRGKIGDLKEKIKDLEKQERVEMEKVLTDAQKARLKEILLEKAPTDKKDDKKDDKKSDKE